MTTTALPTIVLAAGFGTRLDPLTRLVAKPAVPLGATTLVEHVIHWLRSHRMTDLVLNLHHRPDTITRVVGDGAHLGVRVRYSWERRILGSAGGPRRAAAFLDGDPLLIVNGDTLCPIDLAAMLAFHRSHGADATLAVVRNPAPHHYNGIVMDDHGRLLGIVPKGRATADTWHFVGVQIVHRRVFEGLGDGVPAETTGGIYLDMMAERPGSLRGWRVDAPFIDVGTPRDYLKGTGLVLWKTREPLPSSSFPQIETRPPVTVIWPDATVAPDAVLEDCIVAGPVVIPSGFTARQSVIVPASVMRPDDRATTIGDLAIFPL